MNHDGHCAVRADLAQNGVQLRTLLGQVRRDLALCARCHLGPCEYRQRFGDELGQAIAEVLQEVRDGGCTGGAGR